MKTNYLIISLLVLGLALVDQHPLQAQQNVAVFKNGSAFFVNKMRVNASKGYYLLEKVPAATFGTLWLTAENNTIKGTRSYMEEVAKKVKVTSKEGMVKAQVGKAVTLTLTNDKTYQGVIQRIDGNMIVFKTGNKWMTFTASKIKMMELGQAPATQFVSKEKQRVLRIDFTQSRANQTFELMYLQKGISWVPNYSVNLLDDKKAEITLKANLMNDVEDLKDANINFVVGVPNFAYDYLQSPVASTQRVGDFISRLNSTGGRFRSSRRADITAQRLSNNFSVNTTPVSGGGLQNLKGQSAEDLFFYNTNKITLKKGDRAFYQIFKSKVAYEHMYEVSFGKNSDRRSSYSKSYADGPQAIGQVWHSIRLDNKTPYPWTTGTALITKAIDGIAKPLSQDKLGYTPAGGKAKLRITISPNINVKHAERELSREENKKRKDRYTYDLLTVESKFEIKNYHNKDITLNISRSITGEPIKCSTKWTTDKKFSVYNNINLSHDLAWEVDLKKGESKTITYQYKIYVRR